MKKLLAAVSIAAALIARGTLYSEAFVVQSVDVAEDFTAVATLETGFGHIWEAEVDPDCEAGETLTGIVFDNFTPDDVHDDMILSLSWSGLWAF